MLLLIDGSSYLHRAFHALPSLTTSTGQPTGAIYGVINMLRKLISDLNPEFVAVVFDPKGKTKRHQIFPQYKAHRPPMPEELRTQIEPLHEIIRAMGLPIIIIEGIEADDIIGTLSKQAMQENIQTLISTGDKDMAQLVNEHVTLINTMSNVILDTEGVKNKFGVNPKQIIDYLTLIGDTSDNIPGVPMIGPKTAVKLLEEYGDIDNICNNIDKIRGKIGNNFRSFLPQLELSRHLVTIDQNLELNINIHQLKPKQPNNESLSALFNQLEFKSWISMHEGKNISINGKTQNEATTSKTLNTETPNKEEKHQDIKPQFHLILTEADLALWLEKLQKASAFAFDLETTSLDIMQAEIVGISFALDTTEAVYIPVAHDYLGAPKQLSRDYVLAKIENLWENPQQSKFGQNLKYDIGVLKNYGIAVKGSLFDTMLESYVLNSLATQHNKEALALHYLGQKITTYEDIVGKGAKKVLFNEISLETALPYAAYDSILVLMLHQKMWSKLSVTPKLDEVFLQIEMPLVPALANIERRGVCINVERLNQQSQELAVRLKELENKIYYLAGSVFNINSPVQLQEILFVKLGLPIRKKTPKGQPSTAEEVLQELALEYELPKIILEHRSLSKLKSTYTDALPAQINAKTSRIHTSYNQAITTTGRLSSTNPNLQNIPVRTEEGRKIRQAFIAPPQYKIISADYSQIELRIMAHLSQDPGLITAFARDEDVHSATAAVIFNVETSAVTPLQRQQAKTINFGLIYGMSVFGLAKRLGISREEAEIFVATYFAKYPGVKAYMEEMRARAKKQGFVETIFGRRIYTPDIYAGNFARKSAAERAAINAPMQGSAADIIKIAMINVEKFFEENGIETTQMIMQVHDELVFEAQENAVEAIIPEIKRIMQEAGNLSVPLIVHCGIGDNWDEAHQ